MANVIVWQDSFTVQRDAKEDGEDKLEKKRPVIMSRGLGRRDLKLLIPGYVGKGHVKAPELAALTRSVPSMLHQ